MATPVDEKSFIEAGACAEQSRAWRGKQQMEAAGTGHGRIALIDQCAKPIVDH